MLQCPARQVTDIIGDFSCVEGKIDNLNNNILAPIVPKCA
jgi:hypothetical protein